MLFSLSRSFQNLISDKKYYSLVITQLIISVLFLSMTYNVYLSLENRLQVIREDIEEQHIKVTISSSSLNDSEPFSYTTYLSMKNTDYEIYLHTKIMAMAIQENKPLTIKLICVPSTFICDMFHTDVNSNSVYCTQPLYESLKLKKIIFYTNAIIDYSDNKFNINDQNYDLSLLENNTLIYKLPQDEFEQHDIRIDEIIFLPMEAANLFVLEDNITYSLYFYPDTAENYSTVYQSIYDHLNPGSFMIQNTAASLIKNCQDIISSLQLITFISVLCIAVTIIGISGILLILLYKRKFEMAVSIIMGCSKQRLYFEILIEMFSVIFWSCFLGIILSIGFIRYIPISYFTISFHASTLIWECVYTLIFSIIVSGLAIPSMKIEKIRSLINGDE